MSRPFEDPKDWVTSGYPTRARGQRHRDARMSPRERRVWRIIWITLAFLVLLVVLVAVFHVDI